MRLGILLAFFVGAAGRAASAETLYTLTYVVMPSRMVIETLVDSANKDRKCETVNADSTTPEQVKQTGAMLLGWSLVKSAKGIGYATWVVDKSGLHTTYVANYILSDCALTETRSSQQTFDGPDRAAEANAAYNGLVVHLLGK
jgi:hypothetical protein